MREDLNDTSEKNDKRDQSSPVSSPDNDVTMVLPHSAGDVTMVIQQNSDAEKTSSDSVNSSSNEKKSSENNQTGLLGDFFRRNFKKRTVVDDTLDNYVQSRSRAADIMEKNDRGFFLADVKSHYAMALKPFASGGQGYISKAEDLSLGCEVAMKSLHRKLCEDENARQIFFKEAQVTASLDHPAVIPIHGLFSDAENGMHLAMKMIHGYTLRHYLDNIIQKYDKENVRNFNERKSLQYRIDIFLRICDAVAYAHERKIIHRDLKLENIMIGKHRETYLTDWGIAQKLDEPQPDKVSGTPGYIAPEMLTGGKADVRSDIYSMGVMLFELVSLNPAFRDGEVEEILARVQYGLHEPLQHRYRCRIDADLKAIIFKSMALNPDERYQSIDELAEDLRRYLVNEEVSARKDSLLTKLGRWSVNHRRGMMLSVLSILLLGLVSLAYSLHREMNWSIEKRYRDHAAAAAYSLALSTANDLDNQIQRVEFHLDILRMNILFSTLGLDVPYASAGDLFMPLERYLGKNPPASWKYAQAYQCKIDLDHVCALNYLKKPININELKYFGNTGRYMQDIIWENPSKKDLNYDDIRTLLLDKGKPAQRVFFALADGIYAVYPGSADYPEDFYPPKRPWYQAALAAKGSLAWSEPYYDIGGSRELVMTCSILISDRSGKTIGAAAIDFSMTKLAAEMLDSQKKLTRFTDWKLLITRQGNVIFNTQNPDKADEAVPVDEKTIKQMLAMKHGTLLQMVNGQEKLLVFASLPTIGLMYVESFNMAELVGNVKKGLLDDPDF